MRERGPTIEKGKFTRLAIEEIKTRCEHVQKLFFKIYILQNYVDKKFLIEPHKRSV